MNKDTPPPYNTPYPPPPAGFAPPPEQPPQQPLPPSMAFGGLGGFAVSGTTVVVTGAPPVVGGALGPNPAYVTCPFCHAQVSTRVETEASSKTHLFAFLLCVFGCWPCCCIPYCMDSCQNQNHHCPNCGAFLGRYSS